MNLSAAAPVALLFLFALGCRAQTLDPLWAAGVNGPDPSLITPQCVDAGDCNMCKFFMWIANHQNCDASVTELQLRYCNNVDKELEDISGSRYDTLVEYLDLVRGCQIKALIPFYGTPAGTCSKIQSVGQDTWFSTSGATLSCLFQQGKVCDVVTDDAALEVLWDILEQCRTDESEAVIRFIRSVVKSKCPNPASSDNLEQFVNDKFNQPNPNAPAPSPSVDPWTPAAPTPAVDPWTPAAPSADPWTPSSDPWNSPPVRPNKPNKPNRRPNKPNRRPNKPNRRPNKPNRRPNKPNRRPNKPNRKPNKPNRKPNKPNRRPNRRPNKPNPAPVAPPPYNLHYW